MKKTKFFNNQERKWILIDAKDKVLGRLTVRIAKILQGKHKPTYTPNFLCGDRVVVINSKHVKLSADKAETKIYAKYTGYPSGHRTMNVKNMMQKNPTRVLYKAVQGMLPRTTLGHQMIKSLKIYPEDQHNHQAQKPETVSI